MEWTEDSVELVDEPFKKAFSYKIPSGKAIPWKLDVSGVDEENNLQKNAELSQLKKCLNDVKSSLNDFDIITWSNHTNSTNLSAKVLPHLRKSIHPELATQAWCKFYELLSYSNVVPEGCENVLCSVHLCEAPGGFICALNHYLKTKYAKSNKHFWVANTLNPYYEGNTLDSCIVDDRLISRTLRSWCFGKDNTGNILSSDFIQALQHHCKNTFQKNNINLVTADGSLNCQDDPSEQETIVSPLHFTELLCALSVLSAGGNFVVKMFTLFEKHSINFMYVLCCLFEEVSVVKPATSKAGNSEVYVVARKFCGRENCASFVDTLLKHMPFQTFIKEGIALVPSIPLSFLEQHLDCVKLFSNQQITTIQRNIACYQKVSEQFKNDIKRLQEMVTQRFFDMCELKKVHPKQCIVPSGVLRSNVRSNIKLRPRLEGSFTQRVLNDSDMDVQVSENIDCASWTMEPKWLLCQTKPFWWNTTQAVIGKVVEDIHSSLFCVTDIIVQYEHAFEQMAQKSVVLNDHDSDNDISNKALLEELSCMISCLNGFSIEIKVESVDFFHSNWLQHLINVSNGSLTLVETSISEFNKKRSPSQKAEIITCNFALTSSNEIKWPELKIRFVLMKAVLLAINALKKGGLCIFVLPSVLTRICGEVLWVFSQCFEENVVLPIKSSDGHSHSAVLFVGRKFKPMSNYIHSIVHAINLTSTPGRDLLELFPITALLHTEKAAHFIESLRTANEMSLLEATHVINNKLSQPI